MSINPSLLVSAAMMQDYFVDNATGLPMANGTITMFQDNSRTTLKNWYYQSGSPGAYTYITLPNPLTLSGVGTIQDGNGNDTIPFYYPYDESNTSTTPVSQPYYVVVVDSNGQSQFTRQNFPFVPPSGGTPTNTEPTNNNLIVNNVFWRNIGSLNATTLSNSTTINGVTLFYSTIAPSQHDGHTMPDINFFKNANGAVDTISFFEFVPPSSNPTFPDQILQDTVTPEFYLNVNCSGAGTETMKYIQIPLSLHVKSLSGYTDGTLAIQAMAVPGSSNGTITVGIFQYLGTGVTSPALVPAETIVLGESWAPYAVSMPIPSAMNLTLGNGGDDALYLQIGYPTANTCNINIAVPGFYLNPSVPTDDFQTYDQVNAIISSPRTGDLRTSVNTFYPYGWVPMNDGTIGDATSNATTRANTDTWPLFNLLWNLAKPYDSGSNFNPICQLSTSAGSATNFGATAIADFSANDQLALTRMFGRVLLGTAPVSALLPAQMTIVTVSNSGGNILFTPSNPVNFFIGMPITFLNSGGVLPTPIISNAVYYVANFSGTTFNVSDSFAHAIAGNVIAYINSGTGNQTVVGGIVGTSEGEYGHTQLLGEIAAHTHLGPGSPSSSFIVTGTGLASPGAGAVLASNTATGNISGFVGNPFNITQPGTFLNVFIKL
jgi:hypothetical protein